MDMRFRFASLVVSIALAAAVWLPAPASAQAENYFFGLRALQDGHLDAAILAFDGYLKDQPKGPQRAEARFFLAEAKYEKGVITEALREYRAFLAESPEHPFAASVHFRVGRLELGNGRYKAAARHFSAIKRGPLADEALYFLGNIHFRLGNWGEAVGVLSKLLRRYPASPWVAKARYALGIAHYKKKEDALSLPFLEAYLKKGRPGQVEYLWAKAVVGEIRRRQGRCTDAKGDFEAVLRGDPRFPGRETAAWGLAECLYAERDYASAAKHYAGYLDTYPKSPKAALARIRRGHSYFLTGRYADALALFQKVGEKEIPPSYRPWVLYWTARAEELSGDQDAALKVYEILITSHPKSSQAFDAAAKAAAARFARKEFGRALAHLAVLKNSLDPIQAVWAGRMTGEAEFALGRYEKAFESFRKSLPKIREETVRRETLRKLALSAFKTKKDRDALRYLGLWLEAEKGRQEEKGKEQGPSRRLEALKLLATVQIRLGLINELAGTWAKLEAAIPEGRDGAASPQKAEYSANRGLVLFRLEEYAAAQRQFQEWLTRYPHEKNRSQVLLYLGLAELRTGKNADAAVHLDTFLNENPRHPRAAEALYASAVGYLRGKKYPEAAERLTRWLSGVKDGNGSEQVREAWFLLAGARMEAKDWKGTAAAFHRILKRYPGDRRRKSALHNLAAAYGRLGEQDGSDEAFRWLEERHPDLSIRGKIFLRLGKERLRRKEWERAVRYLREAVRSPDSQVKAEGFYRLASVHVRQEKYHEALQTMAQIPESVQEKAEWRADAEYLRGVAYEGQKDWENAVKAYRVAARHASSSSLARAALDRITKIESLRWNP